MWAIFTIDRRSLESRRPWLTEIDQLHGYGSNYRCGRWRCPGVSWSSCALPAASALWSRRPLVTPAWRPASSHRPAGIPPERDPGRCRRRSPHPSQMRTMQTMFVRLSIRLPVRPFGRCAAKNQTKTQTLKSQLKQKPSSVRGYPRKR